MHYYKRLGVAADVTLHTPADVEAVLWIPRVDTFTSTMLTFSRGIQEAEKLREFLKPETGVDLGDPEGLRRVGVDPEAGLVVFSRGGLAHVLFGVEDAETFTEALLAKFLNLGFPPIRSTAPNADGVVIFEVPAQKGTGIHAAFAAHDGLMVLVYRALGENPAAGVKAVLNGVGGAGFFESEHYKTIVAELGDEGPLVYVAGDAFARDEKGLPAAGWFDDLGLPGILNIFVGTRVKAYIQSIDYLAARLSVTTCAANLRANLAVRDGVTLLPDNWLLKDDVVAPDLGRVLPRDTVFMTRLAFNLDGVREAMGQIAKLGSNLSELGAIVGLGGKGTDPVAGLLGQFVHKSLEDRHVVADGLDHLTGHVAVALVGVNKKASLSEVADFSHPGKLMGHTLQLVFAAQVKDAGKVWETWWPKREVLAEEGFTTQELLHPEWKGFKLERNCGPPPAPKPGEKKKRQTVPPVCENYGVLLAGDVFLFTTGPGTLDRVTETMRGAASTLEGLSREPLAHEVLRHGPMLNGGYFSFDGLLKAVRNRNLPSGATRYLAQMYELAYRLKTRGGDVNAHVLLTR